MTEVYFGISGGIAGLIILIIDLIFIFEILKSSRDIVGKLLWILLIVLFPIIGAIIYCLLGRTVRSGYVAI